MAITPRTVVVTIEIQDAEMSIKAIRDDARSAIAAVIPGRVRQVRVEVIQGSRTKKRAKKR